MADAGPWAHPAASLSGQYTSAAARHSHSPYYAPPVFSSSLPSYTLTHTFTFPSYLGSAPTLTATTPQATQTQRQTYSHSQPQTSQRQPPSPLRPFRASDPLASPASRHSSVLPAPPTVTAAFSASAPTSASASAPPSQVTVASSLSSSSPAVAPFASPASSSDSSSASPPSGRSRLSVPERKARRAAKHRAIDLTRRTRESAALTHLKQLLSPTAGGGTSDGSSGHNSTHSTSSSSNTNKSSSSGAVMDASTASATAAATSNSAATDSKAAVLEQTVAEVLRLRAVIATQQAVLATQGAPLHRHIAPPLPHALSSDWPAIYSHHGTHHSPPATPSSAAVSASTTASSQPSASTVNSLSSDLHTLYSSFFLHSPYHLTLVQPGTAACVDTNNSFLSHARLPRSHVVGKRLTVCPALRLLIDRGDNIVSEEFMGGRGVDCGRERQAANGLSLVRLYSGAEETVLCMFRYVLGGGRVVDMRGRCWLTKGRFSGVMGDAPLMIVQSSADDYVNVAAA